jgi:hypothetical protein
MRERAARRAAREQYDRDRGVEPGPWAWYQVLPEWAQAIVLGVAFAVLPSIVLVVIVCCTSS